MSRYFAFLALQIYHAFDINHLNLRKMFSRNYILKVKKTPKPSKPPSKGIPKKAPRKVPLDKGQKLPPRPQK